MKVAPGAIAYLRRYAILPAHVTPTGSFGHIIKGDVLAHIKKLNLVPVDLSKVSHDVEKKAEPTSTKPIETPKRQEPTAQKKEEPKSAPKALTAEPKAAPKVASKSQSAASPAYDPNKPFQQTWSDTQVSEGLSHAAKSLSFAKSMLAHAYITKPCDVSVILKEFKDVPLESFVMKAAAKAFKETVNTEKLTIKKVNSLEDRKSVSSANDLRVGQFATSLAQAAIES